MGAPVPGSPGGPAAVERAIAELIRALGLDVAREPELEQTPARVADFYREALSGLEPSNHPDLRFLAYRRTRVSGCTHPPSSSGVASGV